MNKVEINTLKQYEDILEIIMTDTKKKQPYILWMPPMKSAKELWKELGINQ